MLIYYSFHDIGGTSKVSQNTMSIHQVFKKFQQRPIDTIKMLLMTLLVLDSILFYSGAG